MHPSVLSRPPGEDQPLGFLVPESAKHSGPRERERVRGKFKQGVREFSCRVSFVCIQDIRSRLESVEEVMEIGLEPVLGPFFQDQL